MQLALSCGSCEVASNCGCQSSTGHISAHQQSQEGIVVCEILATDVKENVKTIATISRDEARRQVLGLEESLEATGVAFPVL